jgi:hypothetical protein
MTATVKLYGERNSGTNYLSQLIEANLPVSELRGTLPNRVEQMTRSEALRDAYFALTFRFNLGWKHMRVPPPSQLQRLRTVKKGVVFVTVSKNPYSWLLSLFRNPYHSQTTFATLDEMVCKPWKTVRREGCEPVVANAVELWNQKNRAYLDLSLDAAVRLRYEDVVANPVGAVSAIAAAADVSWSPTTFRNVGRSTKATGQGFEDYQDYYMQEKWRSKLEDRTIAQINERLDRSVVDRLGYAVIEP